MPTTSSSVASICSGRYEHVRRAARRAPADRRRAPSSRPKKTMIVSRNGSTAGSGTKPPPPSHGQRPPPQHRDQRPRPGRRAAPSGRGAGASRVVADVGAAHVGRTRLPAAPISGSSADAGGLAARVAHGGSRGPASLPAAAPDQCPRATAAPSITRVRTTRSAHPEPAACRSPCPAGSAESRRTGHPPGPAARAPAPRGAAGQHEVLDARTPAARRCSLSAKNGPSTAICVRCARIAATLASRWSLRVDLGRHLARRGCRTGRSSAESTPKKPGVAGRLELRRCRPAARSSGSAVQ